MSAPVEDLLGEVVGISDAAHRARVSVSWMRVLCVRGEVKAWTTPLGLLIHLESLNEWIQRKEQR